MTNLMIVRVVSVEHAFPTTSICVTQCSGHDALFIFHFSSPFTSPICTRSRRQTCIARETAICRDPPVHSCTGDSENVTGSQHTDISPACVCTKM